MTKEAWYHKYFSRPASGGAVRAGVVDSYVKTFMTEPTPASQPKLHGVIFDDVIETNISDGLQLDDGRTIRVLSNRKINGQTADFIIVDDIGNIDDFAKFQELLRSIPSEPAKPEVLPEDDLDLSAELGEETGREEKGIKRLLNKLLRKKENVR